LLLEKLGVQNYFIVLLIMFGITILLVLSAFMITTFLPESLGEKPYDYSTELSYEILEPWIIETDTLSISLTEGALISYLYESEHSKSILIISESIEIEADNALPKDNLGGLFMVIDNDLYDQVRADVIMMPIEDESLQEKINRFADVLIGVPAIWSDTIPISFHARGDLLYYYLISEDGKPILPPETSYSTASITSAFFLYIILILIMLLVITILSPDHHYSRYWKTIHEIPPATYHKYLLPFIILTVTASSYLYSTKAITAQINIAISFLLIIIIVSASRFGKADFIILGFRFNRLKHGYLLAIVSALLIIVALRGVPAGFDYQGYATLKHFAYLFFIIALPHELIWRGYLQTTFSRWLGPNASLIIIVFLATIARGILHMGTQPWMLLYPYTYVELLVFIPGITAIMGYVYLRTENVVSCALLHSLILFLPHLFIY